MSDMLSDKNLGISPDRRKWLNTRHKASKTTAVRVAKTADGERENALIWARKFIKRHDILKDDNIEMGYLFALHQYIQCYGFNADILRVPERHFALVVKAGQALAHGPKP